MTRRALLVAAVVVAGCGARGAAPVSQVEPEVETPAPEVEEPAPPATEEPFSVQAASEREGPHRLEIAREFQTTEEAELIDRAERLCPDQEALRRALASSPAAEPDPGERCLWWQSVTGDGTRVAWAVTGAALAYYARLVREARRGEAAIEASQLTYRASLEAGDFFASDGRTFNDVQIVRLELSLTLFGRGTEAFGLSAVRHVLFPLDEERPPLALGDGEVAVWGAPLVSGR